MGLTTEMINKMRAMHKAGYICKQISQIFGIKESLVKIIVCK